MLVIAQPVQAEMNFENTKLTNAIRDIAEIKDKEVIFIENTSSKITKTINTEKEFYEILEDLLRDSKYKYVQHQDYFLIGEFSENSREFANLSETLVYETKFVSPEILAKNLNYPDLRMKVFKNSDRLLIQGLPKDIKKAKQKIVRLDKKNRFPQVKYQLAVIDITEESQKSLNLEEVSASTENEDAFEFIKSDNSLEIITSNIIDNINISNTNIIRSSIVMANPSLVTEIGTTGSLNITKEVLEINGEQTSIEETNFSTQITPQRITEDGRIKSEVSFNANGETNFSTTTFHESNKTILLGLLRLNKSKFTDSMKEESSVDQKRTYAIYLSAAPSSTNSAAELNGMDELVFADQRKEYQLEDNHLQLLMDKKYNYDIDIYYESELSKNAFYLKSRRGSSYLESGYSIHIIDGLSTDLKAIWESNDNRKIAIGIDDSVRLTDYFKLKAGFYPAVYSIDNEVFVKSAGYAELEYSPDPIFFKLRYNYRLENKRYRLETGYSFNDNYSLVLAINSNLNDDNTILTGLKYNF
jgi:hypothetical protein